jgi:hypothetical protein
LWREETATPRWLRRELDLPAWDADLLQVGASLWPRLSDEELQELASELDDATSEAVLRILVLEGRRDQSSFEEALSILPAVLDGAARTSLSLRVLAAAPPAFAPEVRRHLNEVLARFAELQYAIPPSDLLCALDLVARHLPHRLRRAVEGALAAPGTGPVTLRILAGESQEDALLGELFERAETYAAMVAANAAEGFGLRGDVLVLLACRRIQRSRDLVVFDDAAKRLLPEEEDRLRAAAARALGSDVSQLTKSLCQGIRDRRLQLQARLEVLPDGADPGDLVAPVALYRAAARLGPIEDELQALGGLLPEPRQPARLAEDHFEGMRSLGRRVEALADLARHALRYQARRFPPERQDRPAAILPLKEALGIVESDDWLVSLTSELVTIGSHLGPREAVAEVQEAFERVAGLEPWERREEVLIGVVGLLDPLFLDGGPAAPLVHVPESVRRRRAAEVVLWVLGLPDRMGDTVAGGHFQRRWHRFLPCLTTIGEHLEPPTRTWRQRTDSLLRRSPSIASALRRSALRARSWNPHHEELFDLCLASPAERLRHADALASRVGESGDQEVVRGLSWLLTRSAPERVPSVVSCLEGGPGRDRTILELVRNAPLPGRAARELIPLLSPTGQAQHWGLVWLGLRDEISVSAHRWVESSAALLATGGLDPGNPASAAVRRRLWTLLSRDEVATLAAAALGTLKLGGQPAGERAARIFLNAYVQPRLGEEASTEAQRRHADMQRALERAGRLGTRAEAPPLDTSDSLPLAGNSPSSPQGLLARLRGWRRSWYRRPRELGEEPAHEGKSLTLLTGIAAVPLLPQFQTILFTGVELPRGGMEATFWAAAAVGLIAMVNGLVIGSYLSWSTPGEATVRRSVRWVRTAFASVPVFGLWTIPLWQWLYARKGRWPWGNDRAGPGIPVRRPLKIQALRLATPVGRWAGRPGVLVAVFLLNVAVVTAAAPGLSGFSSLATVGALALLHGLFFGGMLAGLLWWALDRRLSGWPAVLLPALAVCWLVPIPALPLLGLLGMIFLDSEAVAESLSHHAFSRAGEVRGLATWLRSEDRLLRRCGLLGRRHRLWGPPESLRAAPEATQVERRLLWFFQGKGALLLFEAALLAGGLGWAATWAGPATAVLKGFSIAFRGFCFIAATLSLVGLGAALAREILRPGAGARVFGPRLFWGHLAGTQWLLLLGLDLGSGLLRSDLLQVGGALVVLGLGGAVLQVGSLFVGFALRSVPERSWETAPGQVAKVVVYCGAGALGVELVRGGPEAVRWLDALTEIRYVAPIVGIFLGLEGVRWLLHGDLQYALRGSEPSWRGRWRARLLVLTAVAPLGGLAIPWWIRVRSSRPTRTTLGSESSL